MKSTRVPRKKPSQSRSQATVDVILDAAARIFVETGFDAATTNAIAERAGVSIGSLYQYFPNKLALLAALKERHVIVLVAGMRAACAGARERSLAEGVGVIIEACVGHFAVHAPLVRLFQEELPLHALGERGEAAFDETLGLLREFFSRHRAAIRVENIEDAVFFSRAIVGSVMKAAACERFEDLRNGVIAQELTSALLLYLTGQPPRLTVPATVS
ncbi:MAG TPA: TetR/AcrR family transcriptional regulator [Opitutaceae bacterium]